MSFQETLQMIRKVFPWITTGTLLSATLFCTICVPDVSLSVLDLWYMVLLSFITSLSMLFSYSRRELGKREQLVREVLCFAYVVVVIIVCAYHWDWIESGSIVQLLVFLVLISGVYAGVKIIFFKRDLQTAQRMNQALKKRNGKQ